MSRDTGWQPIHAPSGETIPDACWRLSYAGPETDAGDLAVGLLQVEVASLYWEADVGELNPHYRQGLTEGVAAALLMVLESVTIAQLQAAQEAHLGTVRAAGEPTYAPGVLPFPASEVARAELRHRRRNRTRIRPLPTQPDPDHTPPEAA